MAAARAAPTQSVVCRDLDRADLRVAVSPLATVAASLYELVGGWLRGSDPHWVAAMRARAAGIDLEPLAVFGTESRVVLDPLLPIPAAGAPTPTFQEELEVIAGLSAETLRDEITREFQGSVPREYERWLEDPERSLARFVESLSAWWEAVIAPEWPRMAAVLDAEVMRVGRHVVVDGRVRALSSVHPRLRTRQGTLVLPYGQWSPSTTLDVREILLMPMACAPDGLLLSTDDRGGLVVAYGAPGASAHLRIASEPVPDGLVAMLGSGRARVLRALDSYSSLQPIAAAVELTASTVCIHLRALMEMELVQRNRAGRYVIYSRTVRGERLVQLF